MTAKERLRNLVDELSEQEAAEALKLLEQPSDDPMLQALDNAPVDDEPSSEEEDASAGEAWEEYQRGESFSADEIKRELTYAPMALRDHAEGTARSPSARSAG